MKEFPFKVDASDLQLDEKESLLFENKSVNDFLSSKSSSCISSAKGFGKTLLLRIKKQRIQKTKDLKNESIYCIPQGLELDTIAEISFKEKLLTILNDHHNWVLLWKLSISLAVIKLERKENKVLNEIILDSLKSNLLNVLDQKLYNTPCEILNHIISLEHKDLGKILNEVASVETAIKHINHSYAIFIDSIDEKLRICLDDGSKPSVAHGSTSVDIWYYAQYSILKVIHDFKKYRNQIKIYCGIRQEAIKDYDNHPIDLSQQLISGLVTEISYSYEELRKMFDKYIEYLDDDDLVYPDNSDKSIAFFGKSIENGYANNESEETFHYVYRHSLKRPRDIMDMCTACEEKSIRTNIKEFKQVVNNKAIEIIKSYLLEIDPFILDGFNKNLDECNEDSNIKSNIKPFIKMLNSNIFRKKELIEICSKYNKRDNDPICLRGECKQCKEAHPFCTLYNIGLLGCVKTDDVVERGKIQSFLPPGHNLYNVKLTLPKSDIYFLHPSINDWLKQMDPDINGCKSFVIGDSKLITQEQINNAIKEIEKHINTCLPAAQGNTGLIHELKFYIDQFEKDIHLKKKDFFARKKILRDAIFESQKHIKIHTFRKKIAPIIQKMEALYKKLEASIDSYYQKIQICDKVNSCELIIFEFNDFYDGILFEFEDIFCNFESINSEFKFDNTTMQIKGGLIKIITERISSLRSLIFDLSNNVNEEITEYTNLHEDKEVNTNSDRMKTLKNWDNAIRSIKDELDNLFNKHIEYIMKINEGDRLKNLNREVDCEYKKIETNLHNVKAEMRIS
jgi:hypothetical protein